MVKSDKAPIDFSIVVPCYNEENAVEDTFKELTGKFEWPGRYELIMVNDGSKDRTGEMLDGLAEQHDILTVIHHAKNRGYGAALKTGIGRARGPIIVITDADGTYPNERIPELVRTCADFDMVVGARTATDVQYSKLRSIPKFFLRGWVSWIAGQPVPDMNSGLRAFKREAVLKFFGILPNSFSFTTTITLAMLGAYRPVQFVPISYKPRVGQSKIKPIRDTIRFSMLILRTGMYFAPLRLLAPFIALLGFGAVASLIYDVFVLNDLSDKTTLFFLFTFNTAMLALLADMVDKRSGS